MHYIYALIDPRFEEENPLYYRYIGETDDPCSRLCEHGNRHSESNGDLVAWYHEVFEATGQIPYITILEERLKPGAKLRETEFIEAYKEGGYQLLNRDGTSKEVAVKDEFLKLANELMSQHHTYADVCREVNQILGTHIMPKQYRTWLRAKKR